MIVVAHVKWFVDPAAFPLQTSLIWSDQTLLWVLSSALAVAMLFLVHRTLGRRNWPWSRWLAHMAAGAPTILAIQVAIGLIATAIHPALLAPNLDLQPTPAGMALSVLEIMIAFSFITGFGDWLGGLALIGLVVLTGVMFSPMDALEQMFWAGIGVTMLIIGRDAHSTRSPRPFFRRPDPIWRRRAIVALRILTGVSLVAVALTEKLWDPELGHAFLLQRPDLNVFQALPGMGWFTNDVFVLVAGLTEAAIGAMLISGFAPRLVILAMWLPFNLGIPVLPSQELLGHLPILGIMYLLLVDGAALAEPVADVAKLAKHVKPTTVFANARPRSSTPRPRPVAVAPATLQATRGAGSEEHSRERELVGAATRQ